MELHCQFWEPATYVWVLAFLMVLDDITSCHGRSTFDVRFLALQILVLLLCILWKCDLITHKGFFSVIHKNAQSLYLFICPL